MRWPLPALLAVAVLLWVDALAGGGLAGDLVGLLAVAVLAFATGTRSRLTATLLACLAAALLLAVADEIGSPGKFSLASEGVFYGVVALGPGLAGWLLAARNRQVAVLLRRREELARRQETAALAARAEESARVERQVDRALAGRLTDLVRAVAEVDAATAPRPLEVPGLLGGIQETAREALEELREVLGVLRPEPAAAPIPSRFRPLAPRSRSRPRTLPAPGAVDVLLVLALVPLAVETSLTGHHGPVWADVAACLVQGLLLVVARRRALAGAVALLATATVQTALLSPLPPTVSWLLPGLLLAFLVGRAPARSAYAGLLLVLLGVGVVTLATPASDRATDGFLPGLAMGVLAWAAGRLVTSREARGAELRDLGDELLRTGDERARLAAVEQRAELVRELHDAGAHALTVLCLQAGAAHAWWERDRARARGALDAVVDLAEGPLTHLASSLGGPSADPGPWLEASALEGLVGLGRVLGLRVDVATSGEPGPLSPEVSRAAYRVVQESLTNAARHASRARVSVCLSYRGDVLEVRVSDTGPEPAPTDPGLATSGSGLGLRGMRERVEAVHGELSFGPRGSGFLVRARLPLAVP